MFICYNAGWINFGKKQLTLLARVRPPKSALSNMNVLTSVDAEVCVQLVLQAKLFGTVLALMWLPCFVPLLTGLLLRHVPGSFETTSSTGLICAVKKTTLTVHQCLRGSINGKRSRKIMGLL